MPHKHKVDPTLLVDAALRMETLGRSGLEVYGKVRTWSEMQRMAGPPIFPLPPFKQITYDTDNGSCSSDSY